VPQTAAGRRPDNGPVYAMGQNARHKIKIFRPF
jgi:hypothetical protein